MFWLRNKIKFFWVGEETEVYASRNIDEVFNTFYSEKEQKELRELNLFGEIKRKEKKRFAV